MTITEVQPIALAILTSIITGGFVLVFVEIGNRKSRENDRYEHIMRPFMHRLSALFRFVSWSRSYIEYPKQKDSYVKEFKNLVERIGNYGGRAIMSGGDYDVNYFTASKLEEIALDINNIWYYHDKMRPCKLSWQIRLLGTEELIKKELREINPLYLQEDMGVSLVAKVAAEFYTDIYQPIEYETYKHEACQKQYHRQTVLVTCYVTIVLLTLCLMLFVELPILLLQIVTAAVIMMLVSSLIMLAVDVLAQYKWWNKITEYAKIIQLVKKYMKKVWKKAKSVFLRGRRLGAGIR